jgi:hypothetical protein
LHRLFSERVKVPINAIFPAHTPDPARLN